MWPRPSPFFLEGGKGKHSSSSSSPPPPLLLRLLASSSPPLLLLLLLLILLRKSNGWRLVVCILHDVHVKLVHPNFKISKFFLMKPLPGSGLSIPQRRSLLDALGYKGRTPIGNASGLGVVLYIATYSYATVRVETWGRPGPVAISFTYPGLAVDSKGFHAGGWTSATRAHIWDGQLCSRQFRVEDLGSRFLTYALKLKKKESCARNWKGTLANSLKNL